MVGVERRLYVVCREPLFEPTIFSLSTTFRCAFFNVFVFSWSMKCFIKNGRAFYTY